jgi:hypothetical protein
MRVTLPADVYAALKRHKLVASELLQNAVRSELRRRSLEVATDEYLRELVAEVGQPSPRQLRRAASVARRIAKRHRRNAKS